MELINGLISADTEEDKSLCQRAAMAASETRATAAINLPPPFLLDEAPTMKVLQGLAKISLEAPSYDYHGLTPVQADQLIGELYGPAI